MKHLLNNISQEEKNSILEQHQGGMKVITENFQKMVNKKLGDVPTFLNEAKMETCEQCGNELTEGGECMECGSMYEEETMEQNTEPRPQKLGPLDDNEIRNLVKKLGECLDQDGKELLFRLNNDGSNHKTFFDMMMAEIGRYIDKDGRPKPQG